jgi:hypothetical protein
MDHSLNNRREMWWWMPNPPSQIDSSRHSFVK